MPRRFICGCFPKTAVVGNEVDEDDELKDAKTPHIAFSLQAPHATITPQWHCIYLVSLKQAGVVVIIKNASAISCSSSTIMTITLPLPLSCWPVMLGPFNVEDVNSSGYYDTAASLRKKTRIKRRQPVSHTDTWTWRGRVGLCVLSCIHYHRCIWLIQ